MHVHDEGLRSGNLGIGNNDAFEFIVAWREDGSAFVDFGWVQQGEHGQVLDSKHSIHTFQTEPTLAVEEIRDVGLLESGQIGQMQAGELALLDPLPQGLTKIFLQSPEFHRTEV